MEHEASNREEAAAPTPAVEEHFEKALQTSSRRRRFKNLWHAELSAWVLSVLCMVGVIITLKYFEGRPVPEWPYGISVGTVIALFTTLETFFLEIPAASAMAQLKWNWFNKPRPLEDFETIEDASNGACGSLKLLWRGKGGLLGVFGALMVMAFLAIAPFSQQIVSLETLQINIGTSTVPSIPISQSWGASSGGTLQQIIERKAVFIESLAGSAEERRGITVSCSTGNCTWEPYQSLGVCGSCRNITEQLDTDGFLSNGFGWNNSLHGHKLSASTLSRRDLTYPIVMYDSELENKPLLPSRVDPRTVLLHGFTKYINRYYINLDLTPNAEECILNFCVHNYTSSVDHGVFVENHEGSFYNVTARDRGHVTFTVPGSSQNFTLSSAQRLGENVEFLELFRGVASWNQNRTTLYNAWWPRAPAYPYSLEKDSKNLLAKNPLFGEDFAGITASIVDHYYVSYKAGSLTPLFEKIAEHLTQNMRQGPHHHERDGGNKVIGKAYTHVTVVRIRWAWIALPATLEMLGLAFILFVMHRTSEMGIPAWKRDTLAPLMFGLDEEIRAQAASIADPGRFNDFTSSTIVKLTESTSGWRLARV